MRYVFALDFEGIEPLRRTQILIALEETIIALQVPYYYSTPMETSLESIEAMVEAK